MATTVTIALDDDLEGGPAEETVRFGLGGTADEIDLNKKNARAFRTRLAPFVEHARKAAPPACLVKPPAQQRHPGLGKRAGHRGQRPRAHPGQRRGAVPSRDQPILTPAQPPTTGPNPSG